MKFRSTSDDAGLCEDIDFLCHTDTVTYPLKDKARNINTWYRNAVSWIRETNSNWQYDDSNLSDLPIFTTALVNTQQDYELPSTAQKVERVEILDDDNDYQVLTPIDKEQITDESLSEFEEIAGEPEYYDLFGRSIMLYPKPGTGFITTTNGLKVYVARDIDSFTSTDTTQEPGFASNFHRILSLGGAFDFEEDPTRKNYFLAQIKELKVGIKEFYSTRNRSYITKINPHRNSYE